MLSGSGLDRGKGGSAGECQDSEAMETAVRSGPGDHGGLCDSGAGEQGEPPPRICWVGETQSRLETWVSQSSDQASAGVTQSESANETDVFNHRSVSNYPSMDPGL